MHDIFVSYAHEDKPRARRLAELFEQLYTRLQRQTGYSGFDHCQ
jgi:hypothetical protein